MISSFCSLMIFFRFQNWFIDHRTSQLVRLICIEFHCISIDYFFCFIRSICGLFEVFHKITIRFNIVYWSLQWWFIFWYYLQDIYDNFKFMRNCCESLRIVDFFISSSVSVVERLYFHAELILYVLLNDEIWLLFDLCQMIIAK